MAYTWGEIQINTVKKMFLNNTSILVGDLPLMRTDRKYMTYLDSMPATANEALLRIMSVSRPLIKEYTYTYNLPDGIYDLLSFETYQILDSNLVIEKEKGKAYYFEIDNSCNIDVERFDIATNDWVNIEEIEYDGSGKENKFTVYKNLIENLDNEKIRIIFKGEGYLYNVRNIAVYDINFKTKEEVFNNTPKQVYKLKTLIPDFYKISSIAFTKIDGTQETFAVDYLIYGDSELHIDSRYRGNFVIKYEAYPDKIDENTQDTYVFTMADEMINLLPLYMASELYKDDDASLATQYRNQFEVSLTGFVKFDEPKEFVSTSGWL